MFLLLNKCDPYRTFISYVFKNTGINKDDEHAIQDGCICMFNTVVRDQSGCEG